MDIGFQRGASIFKSIDIVADLFAIRFERHTRTISSFIGKEIDKVACAPSIGEEMTDLERAGGNTLTVSQFAKIYEYEVIL